MLFLQYLQENSCHRQQVNKTCLTTVVMCKHAQVLWAATTLTDKKKRYENKKFFLCSANLVFPEVKGVAVKRNWLVFSKELLSCFQLINYQESQTCKYLACPTKQLVESIVTNNSSNLIHEIFCERLSYVFRLLNVNVFKTVYTHTYTHPYPKCFELTYKSFMKVSLSEKSSVVSSSGHLIYFLMYKTEIIYKLYSLRSILEKQTIKIKKISHFWRTLYICTHTHTHLLLINSFWCQNKYKHCAVQRTTITARMTSYSFTRFL